MLPYERQQGGWWEYGTDPQGADKVWRPAPPTTDVTTDSDESAGRALHHIEHPCVDPSVWDSLDDYTRTWWVDRARPIAEAVRKATP